MTLLTTVQNAMALCSLSVPSVVYTSQDDLVRQMVRLLYVEGRDLIKRHDWNGLTTAVTFTSVGTNAQTGHPASDFDRFTRGSEIWNTSNDWPIHGPVNAGEWAALIVTTSTSLPQYWRLINGVLNIEQPSAGDSIRYEYISNKWIKQAGTTAATTLLGDSDTFYLPERVLELGLVWRFKQAKGLDYAEDMRTWNIALADEIASDKGGARTINTDLGSSPRAGITWYGTVTPAP